MKKFLLVIVIVLILYTIGSCFYVADKTSKNINDSAKVQVTKVSTTYINTPVPTEKVLPLVDASTLINAYESNEINADTIYKGKEFKITGKVCDLGEMLGVLHISLSEDQYPINTVYLILKEEHRDYMAKVQKGQYITVEGIIKGYGLNVDVDVNKIVE